MNNAPLRFGAKHQRYHMGGNRVGGDPFTFYPALWQWLVETLQIHTVLDVGCGEGNALAEFKKLGCAVRGMEGLDENVAIAKDKGLQVDKHDLTTGPYRTPPGIDLTWCCEVSGHIPAQHVDNFLQTITRGEWLAITTELPDQRNPYHVNCQPLIYWRERLRQYGFLPDAQRTEESKQYASWHWARSGMIYHRQCTVTLPPVPVEAFLSYGK